MPANTTNYTVGFTIHEAKNLVTPGGAPVDPLVVVRCCGREYSTEIKRGKAAIASWDESVIWSDIELKKKDWESAFIVFEVQAANAFWRNDVIGSCALQLSLVHARKFHQVKRSLPLYVVNEPEPKGFLRVTVFAVGPGESPPGPEDADESEDLEEDIHKGVLDVDTATVARGQEGKPYHLYVSVHHVQHLPLAPKGERDPFITCDFAGSKLKSTQARSTSSHSFNECFRIPVVTPVEEDSVIINLWDWNLLAPDELLAHGRLSFAELRARPISGYWFNFYGFDKRENVSDKTALTQDIEPVPNFYLGRLMLSARAERLDKTENLMPAQVIAAQPIEEGHVKPVTILGDVYEAVGLPAQEICVELWCGNLKSRTRWVEGEATEGKQDNGAILDEILTTIGLKSETEQAMLRRFAFDQASGRLDTLSLQVPEDERQQWDVIISVYGRGGRQIEARLAYTVVPIRDLPAFIDVHPRTPVWVPLRMMPRISGVNSSASILITLEKAPVETVARGSRKFVSSQDYELRSYIYCARNLPRLGTGAPSTAVRISCAGASEQTATQSETTVPVFMECLRTTCRLTTDPSANLSTVAPISVTVVDVRSSGSYFLCRAICHYDRVRGKATNKEPVEPLVPRWIKLRAGKSLQSRGGSILVAFELLRQKDALKVPASPMRPELKSCSITFSVLGMRDLIMAKSRAGLIDWLLKRESHTEMRPIRRPLILASLAAWGMDGASKTELLIPWSSSIPDDPLEQNRSWKAEGLASYDFFTVASMNCLLPADPVYDPHLFISVYDRKLKPKYLIGDFHIPLLSHLPWVTDTGLALALTEAHDDYVESVNLKKLGAVLRALQNQLKSQKKGFVNLGIDMLREADDETFKVQSVDDGKASRETPPAAVSSQWISPSGVPNILLASYAAIALRGLPVTPISLNMFHLNVFIPYRYADMVALRWVRSFVVAAHGVVTAPRHTSEFFRPSVEGLLEDYLSDLNWPSYRLEKHSEGKTGSAGILRMGMTINHKGSMKSTLPPDLFGIAHDEKRLRARFRAENVLPSILRLRIYVTQAIALTPLQPLRTVNPFLVFTIGNKTEGLRGNAKTNTRNPTFCCVHETDVSLPEQSRLVIAVWSKEQHGLGGSDVLIGSTVIDLEERWFSREWQRLVSSQKVPTEYRPLYPNGVPGPRSCGTVEMWLEIRTPQKSLEVPRVVLREPAPAEIELRAIIWGARNLSFKGLKKDSVDAQITCSLDCGGYGGPQDRIQSTDVHYYSRNGNAIFNWRVVYSNIRLPISSCVLQISAYDYRNLGRSVFIGEVNIELRSYLEKIAQSLASREYDAEFQLVNRKLAKAEETPGYVQVTLQLIPQTEATIRPSKPRPAVNNSPGWEEMGRFFKSIRVTSRLLALIIRIALLFVLFFGLFVMGFIYPGLFFQ